MKFCEHYLVGKKTKVKLGTINYDTPEILECSQ